MSDLRVGSWVKYKVKNNSGDPFSIPSGYGEGEEVYAVVIQVMGNNCLITYKDEPCDVPTFKNVLTSIDSVEIACP